MRRFLRYTGRRGAALYFFAFLDFVVGESLIDAPPPRDYNSGAIFSLFNYYTWGWIWVGVGLVCLLAAMTKKRPIELVAFGAASWIKVMWAAGYVGLAIESIGYRSYVGAAIWGAFALFVQVIAGWREPRE